jgi:hypothetical protein
MSRYRYSGPNSAATLKVSDGKGGLKDQDVMLWHGKEVELPAHHEYVDVLTRKGFLTPAPVSDNQALEKVAGGKTAAKKA